MSALARLTSWFSGQCNGEWEHSYGVVIETLDNPGWGIHVDIADTLLACKSFASIKFERSENDWIYCSVEELVFHGYGGPQNLEELITIFLDWADDNSTDAH